MIQYPAKIIYDKSDGAYNVEFPDLPGCLTYGDTLEEAKINATEALTGYLESIDLRSIKIPAPSKMKGKGVFYIQPEKRVAFAIWLKTKRQEKGYTQKDMAEKLGTSFQNYQKYENPLKTNPTLRTINKLEKVFKERIIDI
jgi:antitoxin HicB